MKLLMLFEYKPTLGPILLMLREMTKDLGVFILLLLVFLLGFGVSYIAILIPPDRFSWQSMSALFMYPYFQMFGDFYLEVFELDAVSDVLVFTRVPFELQLLQLQIFLKCMENSPLQYVREVFPVLCTLFMPRCSNSDYPSDQFVR